MKVWTYVLKRLLLAIPTLIGVTVVPFTISRLIPGDPIAVSLGPYASQSPKVRLRNLRNRKRFSHDFSYQTHQTPSWPGCLIARRKLSAGRT